jgi:hypothetical protein
MESGLWPANYFDCDDEDVALQRLARTRFYLLLISTVEHTIFLCREIDLMDGVHGSFKDAHFPPNARSLYFDPHNTPKGSIPAQSLRWNSISEGTLVNCDSPILFAENRQSAVITQGALGNGYFVNALRLLACEPK